MKVLIVGAGIAGPTLAYWLLRAGHEATLVERAPELRRGGYLVDFWGAGFDVAERMGIVPQLRRLGYVLEARAVDRDGHRIASIKPSAILGSTQRYVSIARSDLAAVIYDALDGRAELILDDTVHTLVDDGDRVRVTFASGPVRDFDLVVGADGLHSRVRRLIFGPDEQFETYLNMVVAAFEAHGYRPRDELVALMHADVGFQVLRLSLRDDVTLFLFSVRHHSPVPTEDRAAQQALLRARLADTGWETPAILELMPQATTFYFDAVSQIRMRSWTRGRVALVGDAAACPSSARCPQALVLQHRSQRLTCRVVQQLVAADRIAAGDCPRGVQMLARPPEQHVGMIAARRDPFQLATRQHPVEDGAALLPPHRPSPDNSIGWIGRARTEARNGSLPARHARGDTRWTLTSRPSRCSAARAASARSSSSAAPTTSTSMSRGGGPASPA
jgi:2-polyprenyl-6-methoxyphenol hydroxylase-like FAD-dependent oxidoreductase